MLTPVHRIFVYDPEAGVDAILSDLLRMPLPSAFSHAVALAGIDCSTWVTDTHRLLRNGRVLTYDQLAQLLSDTTFGGGWFFFGAPLPVGDPVPRVDVAELLPRCAFVVDILEAHWLGLSTTIPSIADSAFELIIDAQRQAPVDVSELQLMF